MCPAPSSVAVVIPTRNRPAVVERAVRSALAQTLPPVEVVVVDDGSEPPVRLPPDLADDVRVTLVRVDPSAGAGSARNVGVARTSAPLVAFLDDDDEWHPSKLARQVALLDGLPAEDAAEVQAVDCGYELREPGRRSRRVIPAPGRDLRRSLLQRPGVLPSSLVIRRVAFDQLGGFLTELARTEDWDFSLRLAERFRVATVPEVLVEWNRSPPQADVQAAAYRAVVERSLEPRLAALDDEVEQARIRAWHRMVSGIYLAQAGRPAEARAALWRAWRTYPRSLRPLVQMGRTVVGERVWEAVRRAARR